MTETRSGLRRDEGNKFLMDGIHAEIKILKSRRSDENEIVGITTEDNRRGTLLIEENLGGSDRFGDDWTVGVLDLACSKRHDPYLLEKVSRHLSKMSTGIHQPFQLKRSFWIGRITNCKLHMKRSHTVRHYIQASAWPQYYRCEVAAAIGLNVTTSSKFSLRAGAIHSARIQRFFSHVVFIPAAWIVNSMRNGSSYPR